MLINKLFKSQCGRNIEVYIIDMLVKSKLMGDLASDLKETFDILRAVGIKLNPKKCVFGLLLENSYDTGYQKME